ncbi:MAG: hypothetical protein EOP11_03615 [Proteobacteria bacterium]|nr:MAG: hypothetical protein EOP11_03615 [Pseudomonadota bacterium]
MRHNRTFFPRKIWLASLACLSLSACSPGKIAEDSTGDGSQVFAVSPTAVQLKWTQLKTAESYRIFDLNRGSDPIASSLFTEATITGLTPVTDLTLSVRGVRGTAGLRSDPLDTYSFKTWRTFQDVAFATTIQNDSSTILSWDYTPWDSGLQASFDTLAGSDISCSFLPVPVGTNLDTVDPLVPTLDGRVPVQIDAPLFEQSLVLEPGRLDSSRYYAAQCRAKYVDATTSLSTKKFLVSPVHFVNSCATTATVGTVYNCVPGITAATPGQAPLGTYTIAIDGTNTCAWASNLSGISGTPNAGHIGTCNLVYYYRLPLTNYRSPAITTSITITAPEEFTLFPSFAVRALSGALSYPLLYSRLNSLPESRARIKSDVISDFGYGSSFFAGAANPFPELNPAAMPVGYVVPSSFFYGFPVAAPVMGVRPNGYSLDAIRPNWASSASTEGFMRGNLVVPSAQISAPNFLTLTGRVANVSLYNFLTNTYTFDAGSNYSTVPLAYYMRTNVDFSGTGSAWNGVAVERAQVSIKPPTLQTILKYVPSNGGGGVTKLFQHANPNLADPTGLVSSSANNFDYYVTNCQLDPTGPSSTDTVNPYPNPTACTATVPPVAKVIECYGDMIVQAPLFLVDANILTDSDGCRIYATGTVYIQGKIEAHTSALGSPPAPLQISSAKAIVVGFSQQSLGTNGGVRTNSGVGLLDQTFAGSTENPFLTSTNDNAGSAAAALNAIARDTNIVNLKPLDSSSAYAAGAYPVTHVALNAPYVFSNYTGMFTGSLAAEVALFTKLNFTADPFLKGTAPFPMFKNGDESLKVVR